MSAAGLWLWSEDHEPLVSHTVDVHLSFLPRELGERLIRAALGVSYPTDD
ncbi:MAG: hypothetical protein WCP98_21610 [Actinomycetes bacterium]